VESAKRLAGCGDSVSSLPKIQCRRGSLVSNRSEIQA
jgi:hypothetical protein